MFRNTTTIYSNTTERRAPTDESVRLLSEMEAAAEKRVLARGYLDDNALHARWTIVYSNESDARELYLRMSFNGREYSHRTRIPNRCYSPRELGPVIRDSVRDMIAERLLEGLLDQVDVKGLAGR
jgi:hypothetical protein